jgi:hypothetical protein
MDSERFDVWTRRLAVRGSRRGALAAMALGAASLLTKREPAVAQIGVPGGMCGGIAGFPCPEGFDCVDAAGDGCDPNQGGADCAGVCVPGTGNGNPNDVNPCAAMLCIEGTTCCPNCGGLCVPHDVPCSDDLCVSQQCNQAVCAPGEYCCNESCSRCVGLGQGCTREFCAPEDQIGEPCGSAMCSPGEYCCNESCGICAPIGGGCIELYCEPEAGEPCGPTVCPVGQVCCNESCGICTPPDGMCIMIACLD